MPLHTGYPGQDCSLARALELVGERWTMLVLRDAFFGVRRFSDFAVRLDISKAVLTSRLESLVGGGLLQRVAVGGHDEYELTDAGLTLWPALFALIQWGEATTSPGAPRRLFLHGACDAVVDGTGRCPACGTVPAPSELVTGSGPGLRRPRADRVSRVLREQRPMMQPVRG